MGTIVASDIFQRKLDAIFVGQPGVTGIADDMIIFGRWSFTRPKEDNAILKMEFPEDKETMHSFLGMVNFLNRYSPRLAELCSPLWSMILKDTHYIITPHHREAFQQLKQEFQRDMILPYFDRNKYTTLQTDASKKGFGAVILQEKKPIYFASRSLTPAEKNYQNLEREAMAAIWGMEKFHFYLYGKEFLLQTDQKPLTSIFKKHLVDVSPRIRRIAMRIWPYMFTTQWIAGKDNSIADRLSRVSPTPIELIRSEINLPIYQVNILKATMEEEDVKGLQREIASDSEL